MSIFISICPSLLIYLFASGLTSLFYSYFGRAVYWGSDLNNTPSHMHLLNFPDSGDTVVVFVDYDEVDDVW